MKSLTLDSRMNDYLERYAEQKVFDVAQSCSLTVKETRHTKYYPEIGDSPDRRNPDFTRFKLTSPNAEDIAAANKQLHWPFFIHKELKLGE